MKQEHWIRVEEKIDSLTNTVEKGFAAIAGDIADIRSVMATKDHIFALHTQVTSIEGELRDMNHDKLESRVGDLEEEVFGEIRT